MLDEKHPVISDQIVVPTPPTAGFDPAVYRVQETLRDGSAILIRSIQPDDKDGLREHARGLSTESVYHRFMGYKRDLTDDDLQRFTELDFAQRVGLVAIFSEDAGEHIIGVGRYIRTSNERAEVAFSVIDKHQGRGVGTLLLAHLSRIAKHSGITEFEADVMGDNTQMLEVIGASGFKMQQTHASGVVHLVWRTADSQRQ
jgi:GNAT superfamily N-acetyltransferase